MPNPTDVHHSKFIVDRVLYSKNGFSIAYGNWKEKEQCFACRWDGDEGELGFPNAFGKPTWFILEETIGSA